MSLSIRASGLNAYGLELLSPTRPEFDAIARPLIGERIADAALRLKPMLVIVSNENAQMVVSLSLVWHVVHRDGARVLADTEPQRPTGLNRRSAYCWNAASNSAGVRSKTAS